MKIENQTKVRDKLIVNKLYHSLQLIENAQKSSYLCQNYKIKIFLLLKVYLLNFLSINST